MRTSRRSMAGSDIVNYGVLDSDNLPFRLLLVPTATDDGEHVALPFLSSWNHFLLLTGQVYVVILVDCRSRHFRGFRLVANAFIGSHAATC